MGEELLLAMVPTIIRIRKLSFVAGDVKESDACEAKTFLL
jgi:hypothetical protein